MSEKRAYRFGFVVTTAAGNQTRYMNLQKYTERDSEIDCVRVLLKQHKESPSILVAMRKAVGPPREGLNGR